MSGLISLAQANTVLILAQVPEYLPQNDLLAWWPFNGNATDESGNGNHGVLNGVLPAEDRFGEVNAAFAFNGSSNIEIDNAFIAAFGTGSFTVSAWFRTSSPSVANIVRYDDCYTGATWGARIGVNGFVEGLEADASRNAHLVDTDTPFNDNNWHSLIYLRDTGSMSDRLYVDGVLRDEFFFGDVYLIDWNGNPLMIGSCGVWAEFFNGAIDDVALWNRALNACEIESLWLNDSYLAGCTDPAACNYSENALCDDASCLYAEPGYDCQGNYVTDFNGNGITDATEVWGCTYESALNFNPEASGDDGSCIFSCAGDINNDSVINTGDLLELLALFGQNCP